MSTKSRIRIGVSSCLLGEMVRYDGQHKLDRTVTDVLGAELELVGVCPELELGLGVPREPIHLVRAPERAGGVRLVGTRSPTDHTDAMERWAQRRIDELRALGLCGFVLKARSPSCGLVTVPVAGGEHESRDGVGLFARALRAAFPLIPVEEESRLGEPGVLAGFLERVYGCAGRTRGQPAGRPG